MKAGALLVGAAGLGVGLALWLGLVEAQQTTAAPVAATASAVVEDRIADAPLPECPDNPAPVGISGSIELRVFVGAKVDGVRVEEVLSAARRYYGRHGVELRLVDAPQRIANESMFVARFADVDAVAGEPEALAELLYRELRAFMLAHASPRRGGINFVLVQDVVHPSAAASAVLGDLVGLTLSPELLAAGDTETAAVLEALDIGAQFEPTVLLSERHLERLTGVAFVAAVAHELGHALGLPHDERRENLMARGEHVCLPGLDAGQAAQIARAAGNGVLPPGR